MVEPPFEDGACQETAAEALPGVAVTSVGANGAVAGITAVDGAEPGPMTEVIAATENV
jgi:hypothetical protein